MLEWGEPKPDPHPSVLLWQQEVEGRPASQSWLIERLAMAGRLIIAFAGFGPRDWWSSPPPPRTALELRRFHEQRYPKGGAWSWVEYRGQHRLWTAGELIEARCERRRRFGPFVTSDDPLDMLLEIYVLSRRCERASAASLSGIVGASAATCTRWAMALADAGLAAFAASDIGEDSIAITAKGRQEIEALLDQHLDLQAGTGCSAIGGRSAYPEMVQGFGELSRRDWRPHIVK